MNANCAQQFTKHNHQNSKGKIMNIGKLHLAFIIAFSSVGIGATQLHENPVLIHAQYQEDAYIMKIESDTNGDGMKHRVIPGSVRHGRWVLSPAPGVCEELTVRLNGFTLIPTDNGLIQQPETVSSRMSIDCSKASFGSKSAAD